MCSQNCVPINGGSTMEHYQDELLDTEDFEFDDEVDDAFEM
ncbi:hypothetical protein [Ketobacter alkanivorans]|nr:hypothetical protein [Ketobacter alkanivorans]